VSADQLTSRLRLPDALRVGAVGLRARRGRTILTAIGIAIGIAAMVAVLGISASSRADLIAQLDRLGTNLLAVKPGQSFLGQASELPKASPAMIRRIGPVQSAAAIATTKATVRRSDFIPSTETGGLSVVAAETNLVSTLKGHIRDGTFLNDATKRYPSVVLGAGAAKTLGVTSVRGAPKVFISGKWFTVIGILDPLPLAPTLDESVIVGFPTAVALLGIDGSASTIYVRADPSEMDTVRSVLPATANPEAPNEIQITRPSDALAARAATDQALTALLLALGGVALLVGGVGIANVMVISVLERRSEIGLRRALGATRRHVRIQFVLEAIGLAAAGGITGVLLGAAITGIYAQTRGWTVAIPAAGLAAGVGCALLIGGLAGLYPASRAARLAPAEAIKPA
jgi:putative ABC transport system permease protein